MLDLMLIHFILSAQEHDTKEVTDFPGCSFLITNSVKTSQCMTMNTHISHAVGKRVAPRKAGKQSRDNSEDRMRKSIGISSSSQSSPYSGFHGERSRSSVLGSPSSRRSRSIRSRSRSSSP